MYVNIGTSTKTVSVGSQRQHHRCDFPNQMAVGIAEVNLMIGFVEADRTHAIECGLQYWSVCHAGNTGLASENRNYS